MMTPANLGKIVVTVKDLGIVVDGAEVTITGESAKKTGGNGEATFDGLGFGSYDITASKGAKSGSGSATISATKPNANTDVSIA